MGYQKLISSQCFVEMLVTYRMSPSMATNFVSIHVFFNENLRALNDTGTDDEEGRLDVLFLKELE